MSNSQVYRGVYLVTEAGCMNPATGAYQHISIGREMLSRHFNIDFCTLFNDTVSVERSGHLPNDGSPKKGKGIISYLKKSALFGGFRDLYLLIKHNIGFVAAFNKIRSLRPDFIYERTSFLDFRGLIAARLLKIPHFYENNGIAAFYQHKYYYPSIFHEITLWLEKFAYNKSNFVFYVGTWGNFFNSKSANWKNVENGIEEALLLANKDFQREPGETITIGFIGRLMKHHNMHLLLEALKLLQHPSKIKLLLIGPDLQEIARKASSIVACESVGYIPRDQILSYLRKIDIGLIPGAEEYLSQMKLYDYAASKALVICPDTINLKYWFTENEVLFFDKNSPYELASTIDRAVTTPGLIKQMGNTLYSKVSSKFTWNNIFDEKAAIISSRF